MDIEAKNAARLEAQNKIDILQNVVDELQKVLKINGEKIDYEANMLDEITNPRDIRRDFQKDTIKRLVSENSGFYNAYELVFNMLNKAYEDLNRL